METFWLKYRGDRYPVIARSIPLAINALMIRLNIKHHELISVA